MASIDEICGSYVLTHLDGRSIASGAKMTLARDGEDVLAQVSVANKLQGRLQYADRQLSGAMRSTMMMGDEDQMAIEDAISNGMASGFEVTLEGGLLLLKNAHGAIVFRKVMKLEELFGEHAIIAVNHQPPTQQMTIRFIPDGNGGSFIVANIANSLRGQCQITDGVLRGEVATTTLQPTEDLAEVEQIILTGLKKGFRVTKNDSGILLLTGVDGIQLCQLVSPQSLQGEYLLKSFNGYTVPTSQQVTVNFSPEENPNEVGISIVVANRIRGKATLEQNMLTSEEPLMSTRMLGSEEESQLENAFNVGLQYGLEAVARGDELVLKGQEHEFLLVKAAAVEASNEGPAYKGTYYGRCFKTAGNGLLFRIVNEAENKWAFYNDTSDYRMRVHATFGRRSAIEALNNAVMTQDEDGRYVVEVTVDPQATEMFIHGKVNGFKIDYSAEPI